MNKLLKQKRYVKGKITRIVSTVDEEELSPVDTSLRLKKIEEISNELDNLFLAINDRCEYADYAVHEEEYNSLVDKLHLSRVKLLSKKPGHVQTTMNNELKRTSDIKLPKLEPPTFNGNYENWLSYRDLFVAAIHNNSALSGAQKLQYLKRSLSGEPATLVNSFPLTDAHYDEAWQVLNKRYQHTRGIVDAHLEKFINQPIVQNESADGLRKLADTSMECYRTLKVLKVPVEHWNAILSHILVRKLDSETRTQWELSLEDDSIPTFEHLHQFIEQRARALAAGRVTQKKVFNKLQQKVAKPAYVHHATSKQSCEYCQQDHLIYKCNDFVQLTTKDRHAFAKGKQLCYNCLRTNHRTADCKASNCRSCGSKHHTLLHFDNSHLTQSKPETESGNVNTHTHFVTNPKNDAQVILATALINVKDQFGNYTVLRALLDSASEASFITENWAQQLKLAKHKTNIPITGIGSTGVTNSRNYVNLNFSSIFDNQMQFDVKALILPRVTAMLPSTNFDVSTWSHIKSLKLADPKFNEAAKVDVLLGADIFYTLLGSGKLQGRSGTLNAQETVLGWILAGKIKDYPISQIKVHHGMCNTNELLRQFWELEELPSQTSLTKDEQECEAHFRATVSRNEDGRYKVELPFKKGTPSLGISRESAVARLKQIERKLDRDPICQEHYSTFMREYIALKHMEPVPINALANQSLYYMPHHHVVREESLTTKVRIVFDASNKSSNGLSLNDNLLVGPKLQANLVTILLQFRLYSIAMIADVEKMYRQIRVAEKHTDFQRIVWRENQTQPIRDYRLLTVTYGTASAPYQAIKCLQQVALDEGDNYPDAVSVVLNNFYVDDLILSVKSEDMAIQIRKQLMELLQSGGFKLRKWASNSTKVIETINETSIMAEDMLTITTKSSIKTLGLRWQPEKDLFSFSVLEISESSLTKRKILSDVARVFDPLGLISPVTIRGKILLQSLWRLNLAWDEEVPAEVQLEWSTIKQDLSALNQLHVNRCISLPGECTYELHAFSDASEKAYAAVVYLKSIDMSGQSKVALIASKTKVAPIKTISIPRLELCAAVLLSKLVKLVIESLNVTFERIHTWTDSMVVLAWVTSHPSRFKTFVANRVTQIQENTPTAHWNHVPGAQNPADCASRGISVEELKSFSLWWKGPEWLIRNELPVFPQTMENKEIEHEEKSRAAMSVHVTTTKDIEIISRHSSLTKLVRVTAWCLRFYNNMKSAHHQTGVLTVNELRDALLKLIMLVQENEFSEELHLVKNQKLIPPKSKLLTLSPIIQSDGLLRVGGRLHKALIPVDQKHPILLPPRNHLTKLIILNEHLRTLHGGPQLILSNLQRKYWIVNARDVIRKTIKTCLTCFKQKATVAKQMMANLPEARVNPARAFLHVGIDYAGPFIMKSMRTRSKVTYKAYVAVFVCFATRAIHLELVSDMTTASFLATLKRFTARRGKPAIIYSDCGSNFIGANKELREFLKLMKSKSHNNEVADQLSNEGIKWTFNPPAAPHMGGLWEAGVKSLKYHLKRVVGDKRLTFEEMTTLLSQVEACLNSRPLTALSSDPNSLSALTPGHFLIGDTLLAIPEPDLTPLKLNQLSRWQLVQNCLQHFWRRWSNEYLSRLQQRPKWCQREGNIKQGDLVLLKDDQSSALKWKLGRIIDVHPGSDGLVRTVTIKTVTGEYQRPVVKVAPLPLDNI